MKIKYSDANLRKKTGAGLRKLLNDPYQIGVWIPDRGELALVKDDRTLGSILGDVDSYVLFTRYSSQNLAATGRNGTLQSADFLFAEVAAAFIKGRHISPSADDTVLSQAFAALRIINPGYFEDLSEQVAHIRESLYPSHMDPSLN